MTPGPPEKKKPRIKNDEQARKRKRKRPETETTRKNKKELKDLKNAQSDIRKIDKQTESSWSHLNIEDEKDMMSMGLVSVEVMDESDLIIQRPGKRKKKTPPNSEKTTQNVKETSESSQKKNLSNCQNKKPRKVISEEKKERLKQKNKERKEKAKLERLEKPESESEKLRKEKLKAKRKARKAHKIQQKQLKSEVEQFVEDKKAKSEEPKKCPEEEVVPVVSSEAETEIPTSESKTEEEEEEEESKTEEEESKTEEAVPQGEDVEGVSLTAEEKERGRAWLNLDVCEEIVKGLLELDFTTPTPIQQACIPAGLLKYKDVIGAAETGSGKTLAYGIPLVQRVLRLESPRKCVRGLVLCPTRELALQVTEHLAAACKYTAIRITPIVGGIAAPKQQRLLSYSPRVLVGTPGRLWKLLQEHPYLQDLSTVRFLVVDEADRMVEEAHFEEVAQIVGRLPGPEHRSTFLFSATLSFTIERLEEKAKKKKKTKQERRGERKGSAGLELLVRKIGVKEKVERVDFTLKKGTAEMLTETYFLSNVEDKDLHLYYLLLNHPSKTLVFANSIDGVMNLVHIMKLLNLPVFPLHSSLQQRQRFKFLERFKDSPASTLICTDIAARGLDIPEVETVIHYQLPPTREAYIHRSGRTARADKPGLSIAVVGPKDFKTYKKISSQMSEFPIEESRLRILRPSLAIARQIFKIERLQTRPEKKEAKLVALAKEAGIDDEEPVTSESPSTKRGVKLLKARLRVSLDQPVIDPLNSTRYATTKGAVGNFQTVSTFSLGLPALQHNSKKKKG